MAPVSLFNRDPKMFKPLRYLIGASYEMNGIDGQIVELDYDSNYKIPLGDTWGYGNFFDEKNSGRYGPYLHDSDTADEYNEGQIDPHGRGWLHNIDDQIKRRLQAGITTMEFDNCDAYSSETILHAYDHIQYRGVRVVAKNPALLDDSIMLVAHDSVVAVVVERGAGQPASMDRVRRLANKPELPIYFVFFRQRTLAFAKHIAVLAKPFVNMGVSWSLGEYDQSILL